MLHRFIAPFALVCLLAGPVLATQEYTLPTLFDVTGVATDDVLNIRAEPNSSSQPVGSLAPDAKGIEVIEEANGWGRVNIGEGTGWVSMRFLAYRTDVWESGTVPESLRCMGAEPFWDAEVDTSAKELRLKDLSLSEQVDVQPLKAILDRGLFRDPMRAIVAGDVTLMITPAQCSDGMSEGLFGLTATLVHNSGTPRMLNGCCTIRPDR